MENYLEFFQTCNIVRIDHQNHYKYVLIAIGCLINEKSVWNPYEVHNIPEGLAVGVSFATGNFAIARNTAIGIGIQVQALFTLFLHFIPSELSWRPCCFFTASRPGHELPLGVLLGPIEWHVWAL